MNASQAVKPPPARVQHFVLTSREEYRQRTGVGAPERGVTNRGRTAMTSPENIESHCVVFVAGGAALAPIVYVEPRSRPHAGDESEVAA